MKKKILILILSMTFFYGCTNSKDIKNISVNELQVILKKNNDIQLLDVRTPEECENGTIDNALEININSNNFEKKSIETLNKTKPVYIYCRSGGRSLAASKILMEKGFKVFNIKGGYLAWEKLKK